MEQHDERRGTRESVGTPPSGSSVATHRKAERMRTFTYRPRSEARM